MPITIHKIQLNPFSTLVEQLGTDRLQDHLVLVSTVHDKRLLLAKLAVAFAGLAPKVEVLSRQLAAWLKFGVTGADHKLFLVPRERRFALDRWNQHRQMGFSEADLDQMHNILTWMSRNGVDPENLPLHFGGLETVFAQFYAWCAEFNWVDRTLLYRSAHHVPSHAIDHSHIHIYQVGTLDRHIAMALDAIIDGGGASKLWKVYRPSGRRLVTGLRFDTDDTEPVPVEVNVHVMSALNARGEVENTFKCIKELVANSEKGLYYGDFVILTSNYDTYRPIVEHISESFDIPVSLTTGAKILGDPAVSRLRSLLNLGVNGFQIEDVLGIFGDGVIPLSPTHQEEHVLTNIRTFGHFCKTYNIRTIDQLESELESALKREVRGRIQRAKRQDDDPSFDPTRFEERHGGFYREIMVLLSEWKAHYSTDSQHLSTWLAWVKRILESLGILSSAELMTAAKRLMKAADVGFSITTRVGHDPTLDGAAFLNIFDSLLDGTLPVTEHPGKVLVGSFGDVTCVPDKTVFILGLTESSFPNIHGSDDLFAFMEPEGSLWVRSMENDPYDSATSVLASLTSQAASIYLCYAQGGDTDHSLPSVYLTDPQLFIPWWVVNAVVLPQGEHCYDMFDWMRRHAMASWDPESDALRDADIGGLSRHVSAVARLRASPDRISIWDGMLADVNPAMAPLAEAVVREALSLFKKEGFIKISVSQLDAFSASPLEYFFKRLLRIEPPTEYVDEAEQNRKGTLLHTILDKFYSDIHHFGGVIDPVTDKDAARKRIIAIAHEVFVEHTEDLGNPETPFPELLKTQILATLDAFIDNEHEGLKQVASIWGEVRPATLRGGNESVTEVPFSYELDVDGEPVIINGFIDRIDTDADGTRKIIYDYKTGGSGSVKQFRDMNAGLSFQLPVYLTALKDGEGTRLLAGYYHIELSKKGRGIRLKGLIGDQSLTNVSNHELKYNDNQGLLVADALTMFLDVLQQRRIKPIIRLIKEGRFHQSLTEPTTYSDYKRISRWSKSVNELRKLTLKSTADEEDLFSRFYIESTVMSKSVSGTTKGDKV